MWRLAVLVSVVLVVVVVVVVVVGVVVVVVAVVMCWYCGGELEAMIVELYEGLHRCSPSPGLSSCTISSPP